MLIGNYPVAIDDDGFGPRLLGDDEERRRCIQRLIAQRQLLAQRLVLGAQTRDFHALPIEPRRGFLQHRFERRGGRQGPGSHC